MKNLKEYEIEFKEIENDYSVGLHIVVKYHNDYIIDQWIWNTKEVKK